MKMTRITMALTMTLTITITLTMGIDYCFACTLNVLRAPRGVYTFDHYFVPISGHNAVFNECFFFCNIIESKKVHSLTPSSIYFSGLISSEPKTSSQSEIATGLISSEPNISSQPERATTRSGNAIKTYFCNFIFKSR